MSEHDIHLSLKVKKTKHEELSASHLTLDDVIQCEVMWSDFTEVVDKLGKDLPVQKKEMDARTVMATAL